KGLWRTTLEPATHPHLCTSRLLLLVEFGDGVLQRWGFFIPAILRNMFPAVLSILVVLPHFWCNLAVGWRNIPESREPLCDCFSWGFAVCGNFFEASDWPFVIAGTKMALPHFWCNPAADWRNPLESREPLCDRFAWGFSVCGDFFEASGWSFAVRSFRQHTLPSPSRARRSVHRVLCAAVSPAAGTAAIPGS